MTGQQRFLRTNDRRRLLWAPETALAPEAALAPGGGFAPEAALLRRSSMSIAPTILSPSCRSAGALCFGLPHIALRSEAR
jgi:hypothetical protein